MTKTYAQIKEEYDQRVGVLQQKYPLLKVLPMSEQVKGLQTLIRDKNCQRFQFIFYADRLIRLLIEEGLSYLPFQSRTVVTPTGSNYDGVEFSSKLCGVSVVRAGESMEAGLRQVCQKVRIGKILIQRHDDGTPEFLYSKLPDDISQRHVLLMDPMLATGGTVNEAIRVLIASGVKEEQIIFLNLIAAPSGIEMLANKYPKVTIVSAEIDEGLNNHLYIIPGIGDFGDRYFGTDNQ